MSHPLFTVFTPTFNRAHTLGRVYESLLNQKLKDFEWLIVDDGSTDRTREIVHEYMAAGILKISYFHQSNSGKHVAFNRGVQEARGALFLTLDSDDSCTPDALERFRTSWFEIPANVRPGFSGVTCLCKHESGEIVGHSLPSQVLEGHPYDILSRYKLKGEKWGFHRTDVLRLYPFPVINGERFVPESLVWNRIGRVYKIKFINEALRYYHSSADGLTGSVVQLRAANPKGTLLYYSEALLLSIEFLDLIRISSNLWRFSLHFGKFEDIKRVKGRSFLIGLGFLVGSGLFVIDKLRQKSAN